MEKLSNEDRSAARLRAARRKTISIGPVTMVTEEFPAGLHFPLIVKPAVPGLDLLTWATSNREWIDARVLKYGAILFRNFEILAISGFEQFIRAVAGDPLEYNERSSPRSQVSGKIYTSTDYPASHSIFLHNENSYQHTWPLRIFFFCDTPALEGGETPIADCRRVLARISEATRRVFVEKRWMYVRNLGEGFGLKWQTVFGSSDSGFVERHCRENGIRVEWRDADRLRISSVRAAISRHPRTGEETWFNHAAFFHISTLEASIREALLSELGDEHLPTNSFNGDGTSIETAVLDEIRNAYRLETVSIPWQKGDLMMLDNMLTAHGRAAYSGPRRILVGMSDPISSNEF